MKRMKKRTFRPVRLLGRVLAVMLSFCVLLTTPHLLVPDTQAVTQAEIDALKNNVGALGDQRAALQQQLKAIAADKSKAQEQKALLEQEINLIQEQIDSITAEIVKYDELIAGYDAVIDNYSGMIDRKQADLEQAIQNEQDQYELFCRRVRYLEEQGTVTYWSILFSSSSFSDLLDRLILVDEFMAYDNAVMDSLVAMRAQIEVDKAELEGVRAEQEAARAEQEAARAKQVAARDEQETAKADLKSREAEVDALIAQIRAKEGEVEAAEQALANEAKRIEAEIARKQKELEAQLRVITSEDGYQWPLKGYSALSSLCGGRADPFTGKPATHAGIDIPAPKGTPIYAAKSGVVTISSYNSGGYGNYVVIAHDNNGSTTLYGHMTSRAVKEGQTVTQGQVIGYVGSTGRSTGPHLHFEIRENGTRIDPTIRFSGLTYKGKPQSEW